MIIRKAVKNDLKAMLSLFEKGHKWDKPYAESYYINYFKENQDSKDKVFVGEIPDHDSKRIIGTIGYCHDKYESENYWLGWFYIKRSERRNHYGSELFDFVIEEVKKIKGVKKLFIDTSSDKSYLHALEFYSEKECEKEAVIKSYYADGEDQIILSKVLGSK